MRQHELGLVTTKLLKEAIDKNVKLLAERSEENESKVRRFIFEEADPHNVKLPGDVYLCAYNISVELIREL